MADHVFKLDELATNIATHLLVVSWKSTVSLALTCWALEVPALWVLWETCHSLKFLFMCVLPMDACCFEFLHDSDLCLLVSLLFSGHHSAYPSITKAWQALNRPLTNCELNRLQRYALWMRRLDMHEWGLSEEIT